MMFDKHAGYRSPPEVGGDRGRGILLLCHHFQLLNNMDFRVTVKVFMAIHRQYLRLSLLLLAALLTAQKAPADDKAPEFVVRTASGTPVQGLWHELKPDGSVRIGPGEGRVVPADEVLAVRRKDTPLPPYPLEDHLLLNNGDRLPFRSLRLEEEKFYVRHDNLNEGNEVTLSLSAVSLLWRAAPNGTLDAERLRRRLTLGTRSQDTICLRNGDQISGVLISLDGLNAVAEVDKRQVTVKTPQIAYIAFNTELADKLRPRGAFARLILNDTRAGRGGRFSLTSAQADETSLTGKTVFGASIVVPLGEIAALDRYQGRLIHLSDLKATKYDFLPFLDAAWPVGLDGNVREHDLQLDGSTYDKGISLHSHSRLTYRLDGAYQRLDTLVGLDDKDGREGHVRVRVLTDGQTRVGRELSHRDGAVTINLSLEGVRELTLEVDFGRRGDVQDVVNWVDARLLKR